MTLRVSQLRVLAVLGLLIFDLVDGSPAGLTNNTLHRPSCARLSDDTGPDAHDAEFYALPSDPVLSRRS